MVAGKDFFKDSLVHCRKKLKLRTEQLEPFVKQRKGPVKIESWNFQMQTTFWQNLNLHLVVQVR